MSGNICEQEIDTLQLEAEEVLAEWHRVREAIKDLPPGSADSANMQRLSVELSRRRKVIRDKIEAIEAGGLVAVVNSDGAVRPRRRV